MSFVSDELANVLKSAYMKEESGKDEGANSNSNVEKKSSDASKEKRSRKHKHKKHSSKSKSKDKKKHKKRKHRSRSRTRSETRSRSRSRSSEGEHSAKPSKRRSVSSNSRSKSPEVIEHDDFVLEKEVTVGAEGTNDKSDIEENGLKSKENNRIVSSTEAELGEKAKGILESNFQAVPESETLEAKNQEGLVQRLGPGENLGSLDTPSLAVKEEEETCQDRSQSKEKLTDSKRKSSASHSRSRSRSPDEKSSRTSKKRTSRSHSRGRKNKIKSKSRSNSKESLHHKRSRTRSRSQSKSTKRKSKSRSRSKGRNRKRSVSKTQSDSPSHSKSRSPRRKRSHSHSYSKSRSRSPRRKRSRSRSRRKSPLSRNFRRFSPPPWRRGAGSFRRRSRSNSRSRRSRSRRRSSSRSRRSHSRSYSKSNLRPRNGRRNRSRSKGRSRSRSRSRLQNRRSRSISRARRKRSRSRSRSYSRGRSRRSRSRDRNRSKSKTRSRSKSKSIEKSQPDSILPVPNANATLGNKDVIDKPVAANLSTQQVKVAQKAGGKTIAELTAFCKKLQEEKGDNNGSGEATKTEAEEESQSVTHHPFLVKEKPDITIPPVIFPVNMSKTSAPAVDPNKPLQEQFPVSCGSKHREKEVVDDGAGFVANVDGSAIQTQPRNEVFAPPPTEKFDISELVAKRMDAQRRLQSDPNDVDALLTLQEIQMKMQNWCQSNVKPGQFTGELVKNLLPKEQLQGGFQAWAKKDMFRNLTPVSGGIGMKLLQKMGWQPGQVIGKRGEGNVEPIAMTVKIDRKGLSAGKEKAAKKGHPAMLDLQGKHPVSALAEYCSKRKWQLPDYSLIFDHGPAHHKQFLFKVLVNGTEYQPAVVCGNKKQAKAQAAIFALKGLGLIPEDADISAL